MQNKTKKKTNKQAENKTKNIVIMLSQKFLS